MTTMTKNDNDNIDGSLSITNNDNDNIDGS